jgi:PAS domain S-box-containing protein
MTRSRNRPRWWVPALTVAVTWLASATLAFGLTNRSSALVVSVIMAGAIGTTAAVIAWWERRRATASTRVLAERLTALALNPAGNMAFETTPESAALGRALELLAQSRQRQTADAPDSSVFTLPGDSGTTGLETPMTRSGLYESPSGVFEVDRDPTRSSDYALPTADMVNRLEPKWLRWLESSPAEQQFLGWSLGELREKSFLEIVHPDDADRVRQQLRVALSKGEVHGLLFRIRTANGKPRAIVMNVGARYGSDMSVRHLRCHLTDVTAKLRAERELKLRTRELTQVNDQLRLINRELEELKERYRDMYENAPAMYFSLDNEALLLECNETMAHTLGYRRGDIVGRPYETLLPVSRRPEFKKRMADYLREGQVEVETRWVKADGEVIDVWLKGSAVRAPDGSIVYSRSVAQDVTARRRLESELTEKNERLAHTIEELSRRNKEMDEFTYVVSHDLQEPLRTLIAFSDFLNRDYGDRLDADGQEFVRHIVEAARRMRTLIHDLLSLSRVGKVTADFAPVDLNRLVDVVRSDLAELIRSRGAKVRVAGTLPTVWGDRARLGQLLANLVTNGLKYNENAEPAVELAALDGAPVPGTWVTLAVRDNGIGIDPQFHARIFQLFRRLHTHEEYEGSGAGLAICEKIVQAHGGKIWVESEPNKGSAFFVSLRKAPAAALATAADRPEAETLAPEPTGNA